MKAIVLIQTLPIVLNQDQRTDRIPESTLKINSEKRWRNPGLNRTEMKTKADEEKSRSRFQGWGKKFDLQGNEKVFISQGFCTEPKNRLLVRWQYYDHFQWLRCFSKSGGKCTLISVMWIPCDLNVWLVIARAIHWMWRSTSLLCLQTWVTARGEMLNGSDSGH